MLYRPQVVGGEGREERQPDWRGINRNVSPFTDYIVTYGENPKKTKFSFK